ncbi:MAG: type II secretion system protein [Victivallales bacterium]|nr:type II secretion system protein [Victivallales bacterium]
MCNGINPAGRRRRKNMTLLELVIVLGILTLAASLTLPLFEDMEQRHRVSCMETGGCNVRNAIAGGAYQRFLTDVGELPAADDGAVHCNLLDLYRNPGGDAYRQRNLKFDAAGDWPEITMTGGWNGPYLDLGHHALSGAASGNWQDAWGNPWSYYGKDAAGHYQWRTDASVGVTLERFRSLGSDGEESAVDDGKSWHAADLSFDLPRAVSYSDHLASLTVAVSYRSPGALAAPVVYDAAPGIFIAPINGAPSWAAGTEYEVGTYLKGVDANGRKVGVVCERRQDSFGRSGTSEPVWPGSGTVADHELAWEFIPVPDEAMETSWQASTVFRNNTIIKNSFGQYFRCTVTSHSGASEPTWPIARFNPYGTLIADHQLTWRCVYPPPKQILTFLAGAVFMPETYTVEDEKHLRILRAGVSRTGTAAPVYEVEVATGGNAHAAADYQPDDPAGDFNILQWVNLTPGRRKLYLYGYFQSGADTVNKQNSGVLDIELAPGANYIRVELVNEHESD